MQVEEGSLQVDEEGNDDLVQACELPPYEFVNHQVHAFDGDEVAEHREIPACNEDLDLHFLIYLNTLARTKWE